MWPRVFLREYAQSQAKFPSGFRTESAEEEIDFVDLTARFQQRPVGAICAWTKDSPKEGRSQSPLFERLEIAPLRLVDSP